MKLVFNFSAFDFENKKFSLFPPRNEKLGRDEVKALYS